MSPLFNINDLWIIIIIINLYTISFNKLTKNNNKLNKSFLKYFRNKFIIAKHYCITCGNGLVLLDKIPP